MDLAMTLPTMLPHGRAEVLEWSRGIDDGPWSSLAVPERITFPSHSMVVQLAAAAALTERVRLWTTIVVLPSHNAVEVAKQMASVDRLCDGRLTVGVGVGGREHDYLAIGGSFAKRWARMIGRLKENISEQAEEIVDSIAANGEGDLVTDVAARLPGQVIATMLGVPFSDQEYVQKHTNAFIAPADPEYGGSVDAMVAASNAIEEYAKELGRAKQANPTDDVTSAIVNAEVPGDDGAPTRIGLDEFAEFVKLLLIGGNETTRNAISHGVRLFSEFPEERARFQSDPDGYGMQNVALMPAARSTSRTRSVHVGSGPSSKVRNTDEPALTAAGTMTCWAATGSRVTRREMTSPLIVPYTSSAWPSAPAIQPGCPTLSWFGYGIGTMRV